MFIQNQVYLSEGGGDDRSVKADFLDFILCMYCMFVWMYVLNCMACLNYMYVWHVCITCMYGMFVLHVCMAYLFLYLEVRFPFDLGPADLDLSNRFGQGSEPVIGTNSGSSLLPRNMFNLHLKIEKIMFMVRLFLVVSVLAFYSDDQSSDSR